MSAPAAIEEVVALEDVSATAWPPLETAVIDGWQLRAAAGVSRRANSAWPRAEGSMPLSERLAAVVAWYADRSLPPRIQLSPANRPADLAARLVAAGWDVGGATRVQTTTLDDPGTASTPAALTVRPERDDDWLGVVGRVNRAHFGPGHTAAAAAMLDGVHAPSGYVTARADGVPVGCGRAVLVDGRVGVFNMATLPSGRGRGIGTAVLATLLRWGVERGATSAWLQVEADNAAAARIYAAAGFRDAYGYAYATAPSPR